MSKLELILLGRFECLLSSGTRISLPMRKAEVLLAFLALTPGLRHPRERLINLLWSDRGDEQARNSLRQCLSTIRKALGDVAELVLAVDRTTVCLNAGLIEVDAIEFERLALEGDYESLATAADLYQGEFLEGISIRDPACQEWLDSERARFKRQFVEILTNIAETQLVSHDFAHAIRSAERLVKQDPLGESGWRLLMRAYADSGDRNHALQAFKHCRQMLHDELDVDPETATVELRDRIAGGGFKTAEPKPATPVKPPRAEPGQTDEHNIAVLPFDNLSGDPEQEYFSDGITDSIILNLSAFPDLNVKSRNSSFAFKQQIKSIGEISRELGVDYIVEGSIRKSGDRIRITVQLIEAASGNQVWGKRYDAEIDDLFDLEEALSRTIAATVTGQIESDLQRIALAKGAADQQAYDLLLSGSYHFQQFTRKDTAIAIGKLNKCLELDPDNVRAHVLLYESHAMDYLGHWTEDPHASFRLAEKHILRALELDPGFGPTQVFYGEFLTFKGELDKALTHIDKALEINPNDTDALTTKAVNLQLQCRFEDALEVAERAIALDPYHPWAEWELAGSQYFCGRYEDALETVARFRTSPGFVLIYGIAANIKLGRLDAARQGLQEFLRDSRESMLSMPETIDEWYGYTRENYPYVDPRVNQDLVDCLVQAGLREHPSIPENALPSIAVLPFENMSGDPEQEHFSDGITADIIDTLSRFRHMRTVSRYSTLVYKTDRPPVADIAAQQDVRYILEGSVRKSGERIRVNAELIDSSDEKILWSERYDRELGDLFAVQDDLTRSITLAMKIRLDDGVMAAHRSRHATSIRAWELTLAAVDLQDTYIRQNILEARALAEEAIRLDPDYAYAWIALGWTYWQEAYSGWGDSIDDLVMEAENANRKARELDSDYGEVWSQAGMIHVMNNDPKAAIEACLRAMELEPGNAEVQALTAFCYLFNCEYEKARKIYQNVLRLCPIRPNWYYLVGAEIEQYTGNPGKAAEIFRQGLEVEPDSPLCRFFLLNLMCDEGDEATARRLADEIRALDDSVTGRGLLRAHSCNQAIRDRFRDNLARFDLV